MTRANTSHAAAGGKHTDMLESGYPSVKPSEGAGPADVGHDTLPKAESALERGDYPAPGKQTSGGGGHNHRSMPAPSAGPHVGGRNTSVGRGFMGEGRGTTGRFSGATGEGGSTAPKYKGTVGC